MVYTPVRLSSSLGLPAYGGRPPPFFRNFPSATLSSFKRLEDRYFPRVSINPFVRGLSACPEKWHCFFVSSLGFFASAVFKGRYIFLRISISASGRLSPPVAQVRPIRPDAESWLFK